MNMDILRQIADAGTARLDPGNITTLTAWEVVKGVLNVFYFASGATAVIVIIISAFYFITSGDNQTSVAKARYMIQYTAIGLIVIFGAYIITNFLVGRF